MIDSNSSRRDSRTCVVHLFAALALALSGCASRDKRIAVPIRTNYSVEDAAFRNSMSQLLEAPLVPGNQVTTLLNGAEGFPAMLDAVRRATNTITFENFIWRPGQISDRFIEVLSERAQAGVKVHITADALGSTPLRREDLDRLRRAGVRMNRHNPPDLDGFFRVNQRTHRRLLVVDGRVGFIGGLALADPWDGNGTTYWRDNHYQVQGPVVAQLQGAFMDNWIHDTKELLHGNDYFPTLPQAGNMHAQCFRSGPRDAEENARLNHLYSIAAARRSIRLAHAYFIPDDLAVQALIEARERGVDVEIIVPGVPNVRIAHRASRSSWGPLLRAGVRIYQYLPSKYHCKLMIVDDCWVSAGSINFDDRSSHLNDEANINVWDPAFARRQIEIFEQDKAASREVIPEEYEARGWAQKCLDQLASLFQSQL